MTDTAFIEECVLAISEFDASILEKYLSSSPFMPAMVEEKLREAISNARIMPVLFGSASLGIGINDLLEFMTKYLTGNITSSIPTLLIFSSRPPWR